MRTALGRSVLAFAGAIVCAGLLRADNVPSGPAAEQRLFDLLNSERMQQKLPALSLDQNLIEAANLRVVDFKNKWRKRTPYSDDHRTGEVGVCHEQITLGETRLYAGQTIVEGDIDLSYLVVQFFRNDLLYLDTVRRLPEFVTADLKVPRPFPLRDQ